MEQESYRLPELADGAGVTPRTVRYYIAQGLLPSPGRLGASTRYGSEHLDRLRLIKRLQEERLSLAEIRERLDGPTNRAFAQALRPAGIPANVMRLPPALDATSASASASASATTVPPAGTQWVRIALTPGVELHVRRPIGSFREAELKQLIGVAAQIFPQPGSTDV